jgi:hypothetical protein
MSLNGFSVLYCLTTALSDGGEALGAMGLPEPVLRKLCAGAGFSSVRRVAMEDTFNSLYEIRR